MGEEQEESFLERRSLQQIVNDGDYALSLHEFLVRYPDMDDETKNLVRAAFHKIDVNGDGVIQRKEIEALLDDAETSDEESLLESHPLSLHDMGNDDALSLHELLARYPDMDDDTKNLVRAAFHKIDVNGDGVVQRKEIEALLDEADALDEE